MSEKLDVLTNEILALETDIQSLYRKKNEIIKQREEIIIKDKLYLTDLSQYKDHDLEDITVIVQGDRGNIIFNNHWDEAYVDDKGHLTCTMYKDYYDWFEWFYDEDKKSYSSRFGKINVIGFCDIKIGRINK